jgi:hypothetical protein
MWRQSYKNLLNNISGSEIICFVLIQISPIAANFHGHESSVEHVGGVARKDEYQNFLGQTRTVQPVFGYVPLSWTWKLKHLLIVKSHTFLSSSFFFSLLHVDVQTSNPYSSLSKEEVQKNWLRLSARQRLLLELGFNPI